MSCETELKFEQIGNRIYLYLRGRRAVGFEPDWIANLMDKDRAESAQYLRTSVRDGLTPEEKQLLDTADWSQIPEAVHRFAEKTEPFSADWQSF